MPHHSHIHLLEIRDEYTSRRSYQWLQKSQCVNKSEEMYRKPKQMKKIRLAVESVFRFLNFNRRKQKHLSIFVYLSLFFAF